MGYWAEIKNDYFDTTIAPNEGDMLASIAIDAWHTGDDAEEGRVIASVMLSKHGDVLVDYRDPVARTDKEAQQAISEAKEQLKAFFQERFVAGQDKDQSQIYLFYGVEEGECGFYHSFIATDPKEVVDEDVVAGKLAEQLDRELGDDSFHWNSMYVSLPESLVARIKEAAVQEHLAADLRSNKQPVFCLCETREEGDAIREFEILAISPDKDALKQLMKAKIAADEYGFSKENGVHYETEEYYSTNYEAEVGFVEYAITEMPVLSREEIERMAPAKDVTKHISEIKEGDWVLYDGFVYTATSDAYMVKTDLGREWNVEVVSESGPESYLYASYFPEVL